MKALSYLVFIISGFLSLLYLIVTFVVWMDLLGSIPGILVSIFLFFIALLGMPVVAAITQHAWSMLVAGYVWAGIVVGLWFLGSWLQDKAEQRAREKEVEKDYAQRYLESLRGKE
jgi:hypothetical protein